MEKRDAFMTREEMRAAFWLFMKTLAVSGAISTGTLVAILLGQGTW